MAMLAVPSSRVSKLSMCGFSSAAVLRTYFLISAGRLGSPRVAA
jgi:hypothetical protein